MPTRNTVFEFKRDLEKFSELLEEDVATTRQIITLEAFRRITIGWPVLSGRSRFAWIVSDTTPSTEEPPPGKYTTTQPITARFADPYDVAFITNNVSYAVPLEFGHSKRQAPNGRVRITLAELEAEFDAQTIRLR